MKRNVLFLMLMGTVAAQSLAGRDIATLHRKGALPVALAFDSLNVTPSAAPQVNFYKGGAAFKTLLAADIDSITFQPAADALVACFPMELDGNAIYEAMSCRAFTVNNNLARRESVAGARGHALRFDGYSTFVEAKVSAPAGKVAALTATLWCAVEAYPPMNLNADDNTMTYLAGNMNDETKTGFAFVLNTYGQYGFEIYLNGQKRRISVPGLPKYEWVHLAAVVGNNDIRLYQNGVLRAHSSASIAPFAFGGDDFIIGKSFGSPKQDGYLLNAVNGLLDDICLYAAALPADSLGYRTPDHAADLRVPASRHADDVQRPRFHGMPASGWTNEPHGLVFFNGKYHIFFQKNPNGPYMAKQHWGHLSSPDLARWTEERIALAPATAYDKKGCWSGYVQPAATDAMPLAYYTGVDFAKASIDMAAPLDSNLVAWQKDERNPLVPQRPQGLSDDFRDPYLFADGGKMFMIVGTSKDGKGALTLHRYADGAWSNDGAMFYVATSTDYGTFWEMPALFRLGEKWVLTVNPLNTPVGVSLLYYTGALNADGTFRPDSDVPKRVELAGGQWGYGLLSPSIAQRDGKTIAIGIVPDLLPAERNRQRGWAHTYSFPREWQLDANHELVQTPYLPALQSLRAQSADSLCAPQTMRVQGLQSLPNVRGTMVEVRATFTIPAAAAGQDFGIALRKSPFDGGIRLGYAPQTRTLTFNATGVARWDNDSRRFNGRYTATLPEDVVAGGSLTLHVIADHSIFDVFVNDRLAFSVRVYPTDVQADGVALFSDGDAVEATVEGAILR